MSIFKRLQRSNGAPVPEKMSEDGLLEKLLLTSNTKHTETKIDDNESVFKADDDGVPLVAKRPKLQVPIYTGPPIQPKWH